MTIFEKVLAREIPAEFIHEDELCFVIMDAFPSVLGQTLVIPKQPVSYFAELPEATYLHLMSTAKRIARASDEAFNTSRTCLVIEGFEVPHVHVKLYPITAASGVEALTDVLSHTAPVDAEESSKNATRIRQCL